MAPLIHSYASGIARPATGEATSCLYNGMGGATARCRADPAMTPVVQAALTDLDHYDSLTSPEMPWSSLGDLTTSSRPYTTMELPNLMP